MSSSYRSLDSDDVDTPTENEPQPQQRPVSSGGDGESSSSSPVRNLVEAITRPGPAGTTSPEVNPDQLQQNINWERFMLVVDHVNSDANTAKEVVQTILEQLNSTNEARVYVTLLLLETLVKNCDDRLFSHLDNSEFKRRMTRLARGITGSEVEGKSLEIIQQMGLDPHLSRAFTVFKDTYRSLKSVGAQFPYQDESKVPQIFSPIGSTNPQQSRQQPSQAPVTRSHRMQQQAEDVQAERFRTKWEMDNAKLKKDLYTVRAWIVEAATLLSTADVNYNAIPDQTRDNDILGLSGQGESNLDTGGVSTGYYAMYNTAANLEDDEDFEDVMDYLQQSHERLETLVDAGASGEVNEEVFEECLEVLEACHRIVIAAELYTGAINPEEDLNKGDQSKLKAIDAKDLDVRDLMNFTRTSQTASATRSQAGNSTTRNQHQGNNTTDDLVGTMEDWSIDNLPTSQPTVGSQLGTNSSTSTQSKNTSAYQPAPQAQQANQSSQQANTSENDGDDLLQAQGNGEENTPQGSVDSDNLLAEVDRTLEDDK